MRLDERKVKYVIATGNPWRVKRYHLYERSRLSGTKCKCGAFLLDAEVTTEIPPRSRGLTLCEKCAYAMSRGL